MRGEGWGVVHRRNWCLDTLSCGFSRCLCLWRLLCILALTLSLFFTASSSSLRLPSSSSSSFFFSLSLLRSLPLPPSFFFLSPPVSPNSWSSSWPPLPTSSRGSEPLPRNNSGHTWCKNVERKRGRDRERTERKRERQREN